MKRLLMILLAALLLLTGCGKEPPAPTVPVVTTVPTEPGVGQLYEAGSSVEQGTGGAVRSYLLKPDTYFGLRSIGAHMLVMGHKGLTVLSGELGEVTASQITGDVRMNSVVDTAATGLAYYLPNSRQVVVCNPLLQTVTTLEIPKDIAGSPCISLTGNEVYYSTGAEIRAINITTGISRLVRRQTAGTQQVLAVYFEGTVLLCSMTDEAGAVDLEYISAHTGQTLGQAEGVSGMQTEGGRYFAYWLDGVVEQTVFGTRGEISQNFLMQRSKENGEGRIAILSMNGLVDYGSTESGLELSYYDLTTGKRTAKTVLPGVNAPIAFTSDGTYIWMLATDTQRVCQVLLRWDITLSSVAEETVFTSPLYTADNPNTEELAECKALAESYQSQYGIKFLFWEDAIQQTSDYAVTGEYHAQIIKNVMQQAESLLEQFPEKFLLKTVEAGWIKIGLVQHIEGDLDWVQFWDGGDCWILLSSGADVVQSLTQGIAYGIDSHVLGNSRDFDTWDQLNPADFVYSYNETLQEDSTYLTDENRAFTDAYGMNYPHEDRCRIFYHAMKADNAAMFQSPVMQAKLLRLCTGIREAYDLEKKTDVYVWEQYLQTPIASAPEPVQ